MHSLPDTLPSPALWHPRLVSLPSEGPLTGIEASTYTSGRLPYTEGLTPAERAGLPGYDSGVLCLLIGMFLLLTANFRHYSTFFKSFLDDLISVRRREATFSVRTFSETGVQASIVLITCLCQAIIIDSALLSRPSFAMLSSEFLVIGLLTLLGLLYYLWQLAAYATVGAVFTDRASARMWMKGFNASQALLAMLIVLPAVIVLFNPPAATIVVPLGLIAYILARCTFICKGFRLFYDNFGSLVYFILYLCSLEIVPLFLLYKAVISFNLILLQT